MSKTAKALACLALGIASIFPAVAGASVLEFNIVGDYDGQVPLLPYTEKGFSFTNTLPQGARADGVYGAKAGIQTSSAKLVFCSTDSGCGNGAILTLTGPSIFSINSIDVGNYDGSNSAGTLELVGQLAGGGSVSAFLNADKSFDTFALTGFNKLSSLRLIGHTTYAIAVDNLVVNASDVPEPATLGLMAIAGFGLVASRRKAGKK